jgi:hypothetical protein
MYSLHGHDEVRKENFNREAMILKYYHCQMVYIIHLHGRLFVLCQWL